MKYRLLGRSGLKVSELCLGTMGFGTEAGWGADKAASFAIMEAFANAGGFWQAVLCMLFFALFLKMANGATYGIVPFINEENIGLVSGVVGAGGNLGGMLFGFLFKSAAISYSQAFTYIGITTLLASVIVLIAPWKNPVLFVKRFVPLEG